MNKEEIQALREKHTKCDHCGLCDGCPNEHPCDVITVLDAYLELQKAIAEIYHEYPMPDPADQVKRMFDAAGSLT